MQAEKENFIPKPYGFLETTTFSAIIIIICYYLPRTKQIELLTTSSYIEFGILTILIYLVGTSLVIFFIYLKKDFSIKEYLGLKLPTKHEIIKWFLIILLFRFLEQLHTNNVTHFLSINKSFYDHGLKYITLLFCGPVWEETFFRGFMLKGLKESFLGALGALFITSFLFAIIHPTADAFSLLYIFVLGFIFGLAMLKTQSLYLSIFIHSIANLYLILSNEYFFIPK
jgi:membrane protease YdiL (CAAX protease family)